MMLSIWKSGMFINMKKYLLVLCFLIGSLSVQAYENNLISFLDYCKATDSNVEIIPREIVKGAGMEWGVYCIGPNSQKLFSVYGKGTRLFVFYFIKAGRLNKANIVALKTGDPSFHVEYDADGGCSCMIQYKWDKDITADALNWVFQNAGKYFSQTITSS